MNTDRSDTGPSDEKKRLVTRKSMRTFSIRDEKREDDAMKNVRLSSATRVPDLIALNLAMNRKKNS